MSNSEIPTFDPDSADALILASYEQVRAMRALGYSYDDLPTSRQNEADIKDADARQEFAEEKIYASVANTLPGVVARLMLLIPSIDADRWVDRELMEQGFLALYRQRTNLDGNAQQVACAAHELLNIDWEQSLANYENSAADFDHVLKLKELVETEMFRLQGGNEEPPPFLQAATELANELEAHFSNAAAIHKLIRTLAPSPEAYRRKVEIILRESLQEDAVPWLARDTIYLLGHVGEAGHG